MQVLNEMSEPPPSESVHDPEDLSDAALPFGSDQQYFPDTSDTADSKKPRTSIQHKALGL